MKIWRASAKVRWWNSPSIGIRRPIPAGAISATLPIASTISTRLQEADGWRRYHQSPAARRAHGFHSFARRNLCRAAATRPRTPATGAMVLHGQHGQLVTQKQGAARDLVPHVLQEPFIRDRLPKPLGASALVHRGRDRFKLRANGTDVQEERRLLGARPPL